MYEESLQQFQRNPVVDSRGVACARDLTDPGGVVPHTHLMCAD